MSSTRSRYALVANEIRIATEEILNQYLWQRLTAWAEKQDDYLLPAFSAIRRAKERLRDDAPSLDDYANLVLTDAGTSRFLRDELHAPDTDAQFMKQGVPKFLKRLREARNAGEHRLGHVPDAAAIRQLFAESLGIGRRGVLPDLVRLLAKD